MDRATTSRRERRRGRSPLAAPEGSSGTRAPGAPNRQHRYQPGLALFHEPEVDAALLDTDESPEAE